MTSKPGPLRTALTALLVPLAVLGSLALLGWFLVVLLDLKHLQSGFTLP